MVSGSGTVDLSPPPQVTALVPQTLKGTTRAPANIRAPEIVPATPDPDSISSNEASAIDINTAGSSSSPESTTPHVKPKKARGPVPYK